MSYKKSRKSAFHPTTEVVGFPGAYNVVKDTVPTLDALSGTFRAEESPAVNPETPTPIILPDRLSES